MLSPLPGIVTLSRVFKGHHQESFLIVDTLICQLCLEAVFNKDIMKCSITKAWSISIYHFKAFIFTSPISRLYSLLGSILKLNGWWPNLFLGKKCKFVPSTEWHLNIVSKPLANVWKKVYHLQAGFPGIARGGGSLRHFTTLFAYYFDLGLWLN